MQRESDFVRWFSELSNKDVGVAGGKGASLAEMYNHKFPIPPGFVITAQAYKHFIRENGLDTIIKTIIEKLNAENTRELTEKSQQIREMIENAGMPPEIEKEILEAYSLLGSGEEARQKKDATEMLNMEDSEDMPFVAVRSSATTEDLADASFAGQQESFLGVRGHNLIQKIKECFASLFTARAVYYRTKKNFEHDKSYLGVVVQKMINSEKSGVIFSRNPMRDDKTIVIEAVFGLGEGIVSGRISPDHYIVDRDNKILETNIAEKKIFMIRKKDGEIAVSSLSAEKSNEQVLSNYEIKRLAYFAMQLEEHYKKPQDIEFALEKGNIYIVQSRPITTHARNNDEEISGEVIISGQGASPGIGSGPVRVVSSIEDLQKIEKGDILVTMMTNPDMVVAMQKASAIVTDEGGLTSHAAIISREMGIPAVVGTKTATQKLKDGQLVTVDGSTGRVLEGKSKEKKAEIKPIIKTKTKIKVIVDLPDYADRAALSGAESVGLLRLEGIIASYGKHPVWYIENSKLKSYISVLSKGIRKIARPFKGVWIRTSDIRSDEFGNLEGAPGKKEGNPMLGNHGIRFSLRNLDLLEAELKAVKEAADEFPDKIFGVMMPQVISASEVSETRKVMEHVMMPKNVRLGVMIETPAAVQIINDLCEQGISFASFGTNDLTQYTLAIDRNNPEVQELYDEMHPAVLSSLRYVIRKCRKYGVETSICGQAGSRKDMVRFLVKEGIGSISVNADAAHEISKVIAESESTDNVEKITEQSEQVKDSQFFTPKKHEVVMENPLINRVRVHSVPSIEEELILKALDDSEQKKNNSEYLPGIPKDESKSDIPSLNDAIPIDSEHLN